MNLSTSISVARGAGTMGTLGILFALTRTRLNLMGLQRVVRRPLRVIAGILSSGSSAIWNFASVSWVCVGNDWAVFVHLFDVMAM